jgi:hypothetical protein
MFDRFAVAVIGLLTAAILASPTSTVAQQLGFAGAGSGQCELVNSNAFPGRGSEQNQISQLIFAWVQGSIAAFC